MTHTSQLLINLQIHDFEIRRHRGGAFHMGQILDSSACALIVAKLCLHSQHSDGVLVLPESHKLAEEQ